MDVVLKRGGGGGTVVFVIPTVSSFGFPLEGCM